MSKKLNKTDKEIIKKLKEIEKLYENNETNIQLFGLGNNLLAFSKNKTEKEHEIVDKYLAFPESLIIESLKIPCDGGDVDII